MKWILIVFVLCTLTAIAVLPESFATTTTRFATYNVTDYGNGTHQLLSGLPPRLPDGAGHYNKPYYFYNNTNTYTIATGFGTYVYLVGNCGIKFYPPVQSTTGVNTTINSITTIVASSTNPTFGFVKSALNGTTCSNIVSDTGKVLTINGTRQNANVTLSRIYTITGDNPIKLSYQIKPKQSGYYWKLTESQADIPNIIQTLNGRFIESIQYPGNLTNNIITSSVKGGGQNKMFFIDSDGSIINYNFQTSISTLSETGIKINGTTGRTLLYNNFISKVPINANTTFSLDPTFGYVYGNKFGFVDAACTDTSISPSFTGEVSHGLGASPSSCQTVTYKWDITGIPNPSFVTSVKLKFNNTEDSSGSPVNGDVNDLLHDPAGANYLTIWNDLTNRDNGTAYISNNIYSASTQSGVVLNLCTGGGQACSDLQNQLSKGWFAAAFVRTGGFPNLTVGTYGFVPDLAQLQVVYGNRQTTTIHLLQANGTSNLTPSSVTNTNRTGVTEIYNTNATGFTGFIGSGISSLQNFSSRDLTSEFFVNKTYNYNPVNNVTMTTKTNVFQVNCASDGPSNDITLETNETAGHRISQFSTPSCAADNTITWNVTWNANGQSSSTYTSSIWLKVLNTTAFGVNPVYILVNGTQYSTSYDSVNHIITSVPFNVGTGLQTRNLQFNIRLLSPSAATSPSPLTASATGNAQITLNWHTPSSNGGSPITNYKVYRNSTLLATTGVVLTYADTPLSAYHLQTYQVCAINSFGCGALSNFASNYTFIPTTSHAFVNNTRVGNMIGLSLSVFLNNGNPPPTITKIQWFNKTNLINTTNTNQMIHNQTTIFFPIFYHGLLGTVAHSNYSAIITISNATGTPKTVTSNNTGLVAKAYTPTYFTAMDPTQGRVNYTLSRSLDQKTVNLQFNRDKNATVWHAECFYQTVDQIAQTPQQPNTGTWINKSGIGYYKYPFTSFNSFNNLYISCYNGGLLFTTTSYANATLLAGINYFNTTFQGFIGVPVGVFFLALVAGLATGRTAPTITVIVIAVAAIMAGIGFFTIQQNVWGLVLIGGACALFAGKKFL